jgi:hypothetical protein
MSPRARPRLTDQQRIALATASLENTKYLLEDAALLLEQGRLSSAAFLTFVGFEEMLKARFCLRHEAATWGEWWSGFRDHESKLEMLRELAPDVPADFAEKLLEWRERSIYVEGWHSGKPLTPRALSIRASSPRR